jgi:hypothetical protein
MGNRVAMIRFDKLSGETETTSRIVFGEYEYDLTDITQIDPRLAPRGGCGVIDFDRAERAVGIRKNNRHGFYASGLGGDDDREAAEQGTCPRAERRGLRVRQWPGCSTEL